MKTVGEDLAHPFVETGAMQGESISLGLTKREHFAALALQGQLAHSGYYVGIEVRAVLCADALIEALNRSTEATEQPKISVGFGF